LGNAGEEFPSPLHCFLKKFLPFLQSGLPLSKLFNISLYDCLSFLQLFEIALQEFDITLQRFDIGAQFTKFL